MAALIFTVAAISLVGGYFIMKMWIDPDNDYLFMLYIFMGVFCLIVVSSQTLEAVLWVRISTTIFLKVNLIYILKFYSVRDIPT